jgi:hypothetical protein
MQVISRQFFHSIALNFKNELTGGNRGNPLQDRVLAFDRFSHGG